MGRQRTARHWVAAAVLVALAVLAVVLAVQVSIWFFIPAPFLLTGAYAAWLGMSASRTLETLERGEGGGPILPF
jgi:hypothetical protein